MSIAPLVVKVYCQVLLSLDLAAAHYVLQFQVNEPKVLHDRRGTTVYKIDNIALKITSGLMAAREGEILHLLGTEFSRDHGWDDERSWLTLRWIDGTGLWTELERAHRGDASAASKEHMLALTAGAAQELAKLHTAGWAPGGSHRR